MHVKTHHIPGQSFPETIKLFSTHFSEHNNKRSPLVEKKYRLSRSMEGRVNNWIKEGLLLDKELSGSSDRRFSFVDLVWICLLDELKEFGLSNQQLELAKRALTNDAFDGWDTNFSKLEGYVALITKALTNKKNLPVYINVFSNGYVYVTTENERKYLEESGVYRWSSVISIPLNQLITKAKRNSSIVN